MTPAEKAMLVGVRLPAAPAPHYLTHFSSALNLARDGDANAESRESRHNFLVTRPTTAIRQCNQTLPPLFAAATAFPAAAAFAAPAASAPPLLEENPGSQNPKSYCEKIKRHTQIKFQF